MSDAIETASKAHFPNADVRTEISRRLTKVEQDNGVRIVFACESGSRAWGFASTDSDYDVRFVYVHPPEWYVRLTTARDVIEHPIVDEIDLGGWELRKALGLMQKSNGALLEWLDSPVVYQKDEQAFLELNSLADTSFVPVASYHHYRSLAYGKMKEAAPSLKSLCYALRTVLAAQWVVERSARPPMQFVDLVNALVTDSQERAIVCELIEKKSSSLEKAALDDSSEINQFVERRFKRVLAQEPGSHVQVTGRAFDSVLRKILERTWNMSFEAGRP